MILLASPFSLTVLADDEAAGEARPNILWITCEDMSPQLGCYGDPYAITPNLDRFAAEGVRYTHAFSTAGVCAPSRSTLVAGRYATTLGSQHMRSRVHFPADMSCFPGHLRDAGYYCTNNSKEDYNFAAPSGTWDESSNTAHWRRRKPGQPFFSVVNTMTTHESWNFEQRVPETHDRDAVRLPPYMPDTPIIREEFARNHDNITAMDKQFAAILEQLEQDGLADETIVFFFSDHGQGLPRGKFCLYDAGIHVPLIVRFPDKWKGLAPAAPGETSGRLVSFVDFGPTVLNLAGVQVPETIQGKPFLGLQQPAPREYIFAARDRRGGHDDLGRAVRDQRYKYIRNFKPFLPYDSPAGHWWQGQHPSWQELWRLAPTDKLNALQRRLIDTETPFPIEELFDTQADPYEGHNLADDPAHRERLLQMRTELEQWMHRTRDLALMPESEMNRQASDRSPITVGADGEAYPLDRLLETANLMREGTAALPELRARLGDSNPAMRYWAMMGLINLGEAAQPAREQIEHKLSDSSADVRLAAAQALIRAGEVQTAIPALAELLEHEHDLVRMRAVALLMNTGDAAQPLLEKIEAAGSRRGGFHYAQLCIGGMLEQMRK